MMRLLLQQGKEGCVNPTAIQHSQRLQGRAQADSIN